MNEVVAGGGVMTAVRVLARITIIFIRCWNSILLPIPTDDAVMA